MLELGLNIVTKTFYNVNGSEFYDGMPQIAFQNNEQVNIQLYSDTPNAGTDGLDISTDWTKYTGYNNIGGIGALLTVDNNYTHRIKLSLKTALTAGSISTVVGTLTGIDINNVKDRGNINLYSNDGTYETVEYTSRAVSGNDITFTLASNSSITNSYSENSQIDIFEAVYMQATLNTENSNIQTGLFSFDIIADSAKLRNKILYSDVKEAPDVKGLEILIFKVENNTVKQLAWALCNTFSIPVPMGNVNTNAQIPNTSNNEIIALLNAKLAEGFDLQLSSDKTDWTDYTSSITDFSSYNWYRFRIKNDSSALWSDGIPIIHGETPYIDPTTKHWMIGNTDTGILAESIAPLQQYSVNGSSDWHNTFASGDKYIRWSVDNGTTWTNAQKFIGDNAPNILFQYSVNGSSGSWHDTKATNDYYIRFSSNNGTTWTDACQIVAYAVKYQYAQTSSSTFHDNFVSGQDKFIRFSSNNGTTWTNAIQFVGNDGQSFVPDQTGTYANRTTYDAQTQGFSYLVTSGENAGKIYFKTSDTSGSWSDGLKFTPDGVTFQYSVDGTSWHTTVSESDYYMRQSNDNGTTWSNAMQFRGKSAYYYVAYASDSSGNGFSLTRTSELDYWNWIHTDTEIATEDLTLSKFNTDGGGWTLYQGDDGITYDWLSGNENPSNTSGKNGDWYINIGSGDIYKKVSGSWVFQLNIVGATGAGITLKGNWDISTNYTKADGVTYNGSFYISERANIGVIPGTSDDDWTLYVSNGMGLSVKGTYNSATTYKKTSIEMDAVEYNGSLWGYINSTASSNHAPPENSSTTSNDYWMLLVSKGKKGDNGTNGVDGNGIASISKTGTSGKVDTYTTTYTDETTSTFTVTNGTDGKTILNGTGAPSNDLGTDGDFYLDTNALNLYLKVSGAWTLKGSLAAGLQFAVAQADGDESTKTVSIRTVTVSADGSSVYSGEAQTVLYDFNIPTEGA